LLICLSAHVRVCVQLKAQKNSSLFCLSLFPLSVQYLLLYLPLIKNLVSCNGRHLLTCCRSHQLLAGLVESIKSSPPAVNYCTAVVFAVFWVKFDFPDFLRFPPDIADFISEAPIAIDWKTSICKACFKEAKNYQ
jgi:hypothetical protein